MSQGAKRRSDEATEGGFPPSSPPSLRPFVASSLSWSLFLAISWTWCIGMYLPVLLVRDLGFWGWVVFAVPNVVGAAAMAWILPDADSSRRLVERHRTTCLWFSIVTIAFHVFFVGWMVQWLIGPGGIAMAALVAALTLAMCLRRGDGDRWCAAAVFLISVILALILLARSQLSLPSPTTLPPRALWGLAALTPVCMLGFFLCPYLDLTFHHARQATGPAAGRRAFGIGFGFFFLLMILFTLGYALPLGKRAAEAAGLLALLVGLHMAIQSGFTVALHLREVLTPRPRQGNWTAALCITAVAAALAAAFTRSGGNWLGLAQSEIIYRLFMGFYGLLFPAYVWICIRNAPIHQTHRHRLMFLIAVLAAAPFFALGFLARQWLWLLPGVALVLGARFAMKPRKA